MEFQGFTTNTEIGYNLIIENSLKDKTSQKNEKNIPVKSAHRI